MLDTLLKIGEWQKKGKSEWDRFLEKPNVFKETKKGESITNYVVEIIFNLDEKKVYLGSKKEYDEEKDAGRFKSLKIQGGNNKAIYVTSEPQKLIQIFKTFFGKVDGENLEKGELTEAIDKDFQEFKNSSLYKIAQRIFPLRGDFLTKALKDDKGKKKFDEGKFFEELHLGKNEKIALVFASIKSKELGFNNPTPIAQIEEYQKFIEAKFLKTPLKEDDVKGKRKLCYASGELKEDVNELNLSVRYSLNKTFVTTTTNYLFGFKKTNSSINYQVSAENQGYLDIASRYLLENFSVAIADIDHCVIPEFLSTDNIELSVVLESIRGKADLLFRLKSLDEIAKFKDIESDVPFWINFIAIDSPKDRKYLKVNSIIKDVSKFHFQKVLKTFQEIDWEMREMKEAVNCNSATMECGKASFFNLNSVYGLIPVRKDKEKKNIALQLLKSILEQRKVEPQQLFQHFTELLLCHYYKRYKSYTNIRDDEKKDFGFVIRDCVFKYFAFIEALKKLKLIDMAQEEQTAVVEETTSSYEKRIDDFFKKMQFTTKQKAMFYLGRMLNTVVYMQKDKSKTAIDKVNFNGMDRDDIVRLRKDLFEKAKQYREPQKIIFSDSNFGSHFDFNSWDMNPQEAVFFLLTGYSFGIVKND